MIAQASDVLTFGQIVMVAVAVVGEFLAILFVYRILVRGGSTASNLLWMAVILLAPWIGLLLYYLLPRRISLRRLRRIKQRGARARESRVGGHSPDDVTGVAALFTNDDGGLCRGNSIQWLPGGEEFFAAAEAAIGAARRQIHVVVYIFRPDTAGLRFLEWLTAAARRGVTVRLLFDSLGSLGLNSSHLQPLHDAGGRAEAFLPLLWKRRPFTVNLRNHRKFLVVDGEVGFVGGRNIGDEYKTDRVGQQRRWLDAMVAVRGPAVGLLQDVFLEDWCTATDELIEDTVRPPAHPPAGDEIVGIAGSGPDREHSQLWFAVVQALTDARHSIELSSPYLLPPPMLLFALQLAVARGVRVRLHTNGAAAVAAVLYHAQRNYYRRLLDVGIEIYETVEDYNHSKLLVTDARTVIVGSANLDLRSVDLNFEIAVVVVDSPQLAGEVLATIERRQAGSRRITTAQLPRNPFARAIDGFCGLLGPLL